MKNKIIRYAPITAGALVSVVSVLFLAEAVRLIDLDLEFFAESFDNWSQFTPYFILGLVFGCIGFPLFLRGLERLEQEP